MAITTGNRLSVQERDVVDEAKLKEHLNALAALEETRQVLRKLPPHGVLVPEEAADHDEPMTTNQPENPAGAPAGSSEEQIPPSDSAGKRVQEAEGAEEAEPGRKVVVTASQGAQSQDLE
jgi:hypothetical protein